LQRCWETFVALQGIFYAAAVFASGMAVAAYFIRDEHVSHEGARAGAAVIVAEVTMIGVAAVAGKLATTWGRKPLFLVACVALVLRSGLSVVNHNPYYLIGLQVLDGVAAAIYGVLLTLVSADLAKGTGRFNFLPGAIQFCMGLGGFLSNGFFGFLAKSRGFNAAFLGLSGAAVVAGVLSQAKMPETKGEVTEI
jgi:MFS family permease